MPRPAEPIRARRGPRGCYLVSYAEAPGQSFTAAVANSEPREAVMAWAKRNRNRLLESRRDVLTLRPLMAGFFAPDGDWIERYRAKGKSMSAANLANYAAHLANYLLPLFGDEEPAALTARAIDDAILAAPGRNGRPLAPATKYKIVHTFSLILDDLTERGIIPRNPLAGVLPYSKRPVRERGTITPEHVILMFPDAHGDLVRIWGSTMWASMMLTFSDTGLRPIECARLRWGEMVREGEGKTETFAFVFLGAKGGQVRAVWISKRTAQELAIWRAESRHAEDDDYVFGDGSAPLTDNGILKAFRAGAVRAVGPEAATWITYSLRHTFVTRGLSILGEEALAMLAGHSVQVSRSHYQHAGVKEALDRSREARRKLDAARG